MRFVWNSKLWESNQNLGSAAEKATDRDDGFYTRTKSIYSSRLRMLA
jgi:hypothetical protein